MQGSRKQLEAQSADRVRATLLCQVEIESMSLGAVLPRCSLGTIDLRMQRQRRRRKGHDDVVTLTAPARVKRVGREMRILVAQESKPRNGAREIFASRSRRDQA
jgi:hypothetical protein